METLSARDTLLKSRLTEKILLLNDEVLERLKQLPTFSLYVQQAFDTAFATLTTPVNLSTTFIKVSADTSLSDTLSDEGALAPLLPTLMDAVAERIVNNKATTYTQRTVSFHLTLDTKEDTETVTGLTAEAFANFLNNVAVNLGTQFKKYVDEDWNGPLNPTDTRTCKEWVAEKHLEIMKAEVALLKADGVLDTAAELLLMQVIRSPDALSRVALPGYRPCAYGLAVNDKLSTDIPLYGALVLTSRDQDDATIEHIKDRPPPRVRDITPSTNVGHVLLFLPGSGFEAFDSLASLDRELHRRLNSPEEFAAILSLMEEKDQPSGLAFHLQQIDSNQFRYIERLESVFTQAIDSLYNQAHAQFTWMVAHYQGQKAHIDSWQLPASLDRVADLARVFDASGVLTARLNKQIQLQFKQFLKDATVNDKQAWETAVRSYCDQLLTLSAPDGLPSLSQYSDRATLLAYSNEQLRRVLEADHSLTVNPDDIVVHTKQYVTRQTGTYVVGGKPHPSEPGARIFDSRERTLTELALENVEWIDLNFVNFSSLTDKHKTPYTALSVVQVKDLVRKINIGDSYEKFLKARLVTSDTAKAEQQRYIQVMDLQMRVDAIEAKIAGDFLPDRLERGFNWVMSVLDGPIDDDKRRNVEEHRIIVSSLKLRGERVRGVLVFTTGTQSVASMVVYTPQAVGGRVFHEYADAASMHRDFINHSAWREYLVGRTELSAQARIRGLLTSGAGAPVIALSRIADHFLDEAYLSEASVVINDANAQSTSTQEADLESTTTLVTVALDVATMFLPVKIMLPIGLARSILSVINAVEAAQAGDRETAAHYIVRALGELVGAAIDGAVGVGTARAARKPRPANPGLNTKLSLAKKPDGITPLAGWETHHIYVRDGVEPNTFAAPEHFLLDKNRWYSIRRDNDAQVWRLKDPRRASSAYKGDPLFRNSQGLWEICSPGLKGEGLGLLGGAPAPTAGERALMDLFPYLDAEQAQRVFALFVFPTGRAHELQMSLIHRLRTSLSLPTEYHQYLLATSAQFDALIRGRRLSSTLTPSPAEPIAGPSRAVQAPAPGTSTPPTEQRFLDWGQSLDLSTHATIPGRVQIRRAPASQPGATPQEYIQLGERYYATLPGASAEEGAVLVPNNRRYSTYREFEDLLRYDRYEQPRLGVYSASLSRWLIGLVPYQQTLARYIKTAFPQFAFRSAEQLAEALFANTNPRGLTTDGYLRLLNTVRDWRTWSSMPSITPSDPMLLLSTHPLAHGLDFWTFDSSRNNFTLLELSVSRMGTLSNEAVRYQNDATTATLMGTLLRYSGYEVFTIPRQSHLLFRRRGHLTVYWLSLRRTPSQTLAYRNYAAPAPHRNSFQNLPPDVRAMALQAHASGNFVALIGVLRIDRSARTVTPFIFRP